MSDSIRKRGDWPRGFFSMWDSQDPHGDTRLILPDGQIVSISHHADPSVNPAQVEWMVEVLNRELKKIDSEGGEA